MSNNAKFVQGIIAKPPHERAPEYVKARLSIKREELIAWLQTESGEWINADVKVGQSGRWYVAVDDWKPEGQRQSAPPSRGRQPDRQQTRQAPRQAPPADDDFNDPIPW